MSWQYDTITKRQAEVLMFILDFTEDNGYPPSHRDIAKNFGLVSTNGVNDHLRLLENKGCIARKKLLSRSLHVTDEGVRMLAEAVRE